MREMVGWWRKRKELLGWNPKYLDPSTPLLLTCIIYVALFMHFF